ncbi:hypothetical protein D7V88_36565 [Corallococcus terminator]|uniref:Uncharacterized protein n=1 Tax=Corallococcus terminator TaxID=2316733 RepID=A0A3A8I0V8_9BACT|nr:hypothetical protein D7V88_36565 [Corallococcus terminator]
MPGMAGPQSTRGFAAWASEAVGVSRAVLQPPSMRETASSDHGDIRMEKHLLGETREAAV